LSRLWDSGQEWILIFDNLLKHPGGKAGKGCKCDMCEMQKPDLYHGGLQVGVGTPILTKTPTNPDWNFKSSSSRSVSRSGSISGFRSGAASPCMSGMKKNPPYNYCLDCSIYCERRLIIYR
jgi:hypothetical protein